MKRRGSRSAPPGGAPVLEICHEFGFDAAHRFPAAPRGHRYRGMHGHSFRVEIAGLRQPSLENLCLWIWDRLAPQFRGLTRVTVRRDSLGQSCTYLGPAGTSASPQSPIR